jgi:predicted metal-dependent hydrolase
MKSQKRSFKLYKNERIIEIGNQKIEYEIERRRVKYARLEFFGRKLRIILPRNYKDEEAIITKKIDWILNKYRYLTSLMDENIKNNFSLFGKLKPLEVNGTYVNFEGMNLKKEDFILLLKKILSEKLVELVKKYSNEMKVKERKIVVRVQKTKWASLSSNGTLSFNLKLVSLPEDLIEYVVYHEMLHFFEKRHNPNFIRKIKEKFKDAEAREEKLRSFWVSLAENEIWRNLLKKRLN